MPKLVIQMPEGGDNSYDLEDDMITVGRTPDNKIVIEDGSVSSHHAQLNLVAGSYHLKDLNSTNGTRANGDQVAEITLKDGDRLRFGKVMAEYYTGADHGSQPLPEAERASAKVAEASRRPSDFANASPFKGKKKKRDPLGAGAYALLVLAFLALIAAVALTYMLKSPV